MEEAGPVNAISGSEKQANDHEPVPNTLELAILGYDADPLWVSFFFVELLLELVQIYLVADHLAAKELDLGVDGQELIDDDS